MLKLFLKTIIVLVVGVLIFSGCRPPAVEGTVLKIKNEEYDDALVSAEEAVQSNPANAEAWFYYGWLNGEHANNFEKMNEGLDKALALNPQQKVIYNTHNITIEEGVKAVRSGLFTSNYNGAIATVNKARQMESGAEKTESYQKALEKFQMAMKADPSRVEPYQPVAVTYLSLGDTAQAEAFLKEGLAKNPNDEMLVISSAEVYSMSGKTDKAFELFNKALEINPSNGAIYQKLGVIEANRKNWESANQYYQKAIDLDPENADLIYNIGVGFYNQEKVDDAIPYFEKSIDLEPNNDLIYTILASCYNRAEMHDKSITFLKDALQVYPEKAELWSYLAVAYANKGMTNEAKEAQKKVKELQGN